MVMDRLLGRRLIWLDVNWTDATALRKLWRGPLQDPWRVVHSIEELRRTIADSSCDLCLWHQRALGSFEEARRLLGEFKGLSVVATVDDDTPVADVVALSRSGVECVRAGPEDAGPWIEAAGRAIGRGRERLLQDLEEQRRVEQDGPGRMIGQGAWMTGVREFVTELSSVTHGLAVLRAEPGAGRRRLARAVDSQRPHGRLIRLRAGELRDVAAERLLGSFARPGVLEFAEGGTVLIEAPDALSRAAFDRLRCYAESGAIDSVDGARRAQGRAVVIVSVSGDEAESRARDLEPVAARGELPPLRERREDLPALSEHFCRCASALLGRSFGISSAALAVLGAHDWPGNLHELQQAMFAAVHRSSGDLVEVRDLAYEIRRGSCERGAGRGFVLPRDGIQVADVMADLLDQALQMSAGNKTVAAQLLGIHRDQVRYWVKKYSLEKWVRVRGEKGAAKEQGAS